MAYYDFWPPFMRALHDTPKVPWVEVAANGIWEATEAKRVDYESLNFPRVVLRLPPAREWHGIATTHIYMQPVEYYYLNLTPGGATEPFRERLQALRRHIQQVGLIDATTGDRFQVLEEDWFEHVYDAHEINEILLLRNNSAQGGALGFVALVGDDNQ